MEGLEALGLSNGEIKTYTALLEIGEAQVGPIIAKTDLAASAIHNAIHALQEKGLVSYVKKGKVKRYRATEPRQLLVLAEKNKQEIAKLIPQLEARKAFSSEKEEAEIFEGVSGIMAMLHVLIDDVKKGSEYLFFAVNVPEQNEEIQRFFRRYDAKRNAQGLHTKGVAPLSMKQLFEKRQLNMRYTNSPIPSNISICNGKIALFSWHDKPVGYLITSEQLVQSYAAYFNKVWKEC